MSDTAPSVLADDIEPFSLYLDLEPGQLIDLDSAAKISLALSSAIREAAFVLDPSISVRVMLLSGTEGSFSLNTFIKSLKPKDILAKINLKSVAVACLLLRIPIYPPMHSNAKPPIDSDLKPPGVPI